MTYYIVLATWAGDDIPFTTIDIVTTDKEEAAEAFKNAVAEAKDSKWGVTEIDEDDHFYSRSPLGTTVQVSLKEHTSRGKQ